VGFSLGLLALFSRKMNRETVPLRWLADRSFAVYVLHAPVLVALFMLCRALPQNPFALAALLTVAGLVISFAVADLARRLPGLRAIL
jgi:glucans biosynthesis protein C